MKIVVIRGSGLIGSKLATLTAAALDALAQVHLPGFRAKAGP